MQQNSPPVARALEAGCRIVFAIPDHPWPSGPDTAKVRVAMTVLAPASDTARPVLALAPDHDQVATARGRTVLESDLQKIYPGTIGADLSPSVSLTGLCVLRSNAGLDSAGVKPYARTLLIDDARARSLFPSASDRERHTPPYRNGKDIGQRPRGLHVVDLFGLTEAQVAKRFPVAYQYLLTHTKPERKQERNPRLRDEWWLFEANRPELRRAIAGQERYIVTVENSPVRAFVFLETSFLPDQKLRVVASNDAWVMGVLSSRAHRLFAERLGGRHGVANTPVYNSRCFASFPFPDASEEVRAEIRALGERLDAHRKRQQAAHENLTLTGMYNILEKLRSGEPLTAKEKLTHEQGLVSVLKKLHDDLDAAVFDAYGWPHDLTDEQILERLVALNAERAEEERNGLVRWLRPDYQNPGAKREMAQVAMAEVEDAAEADEEAEGNGKPAPTAAASPWPKKLGEQIAAVRDLVTKRSSEWSAEQVAAAFAGAKKGDAAEVLDGLAALGMLVGYEAAQGRRWRTSRAAG